MFPKGFKTQNSESGHPFGSSFPGQ